MTELLMAAGGPSTSMQLLNTRQKQLGISRNVAIKPTLTIQANLAQMDGPNIYKTIEERGGSAQKPKSRGNSS